MNVQKTKTVRFLFISLLTIAGIVVLQPWYAESADETITITESGCYQKEYNTGSSIELTYWMQSPDCDISVVNTSSTVQNTIFTIENINPFFAVVSDNSDNQYSLTATEENTITFEAIAAANTTTTISVSPWNSEEDSEKDGIFTFSAFSDPQSHVTGDPNPVFRHIMAQTDTLGIPFTTITGDLIKGSSTDSVHENYMNNFLGELDGHPGPIYTVPGDHEALNDQDVYYTEELGERFYAFTYESTRFIAINSVEDREVEGTFSDEDYAVVESLLNAAASAKEQGSINHIIVLMHHPLVPPSWANSPGIAESSRQQVAQDFIDAGVDVLITGDVHGYDYATLDATDISGISGTIQQLIVGGGGGSMSTYTGEHFYTLVSVTPSSITHTKVDYTDIDVSVEYEYANDGTSDTQEITILNEGSQDIPFLRLPYEISGTGHSLITDEGEYIWPTATYSDGDTTKGYIDFENPNIEESLTITIAQQTQLLQGIDNPVNQEGYIEYAENNLPDEEDTAVSAYIESVSDETIISIDEWNEETGTRRFTENTSVHAETGFRVTQLDAGREYFIWVNNDLEQRVVADSSGELTFTTTSADTEREYSLVEGDVIPSTIGVLPGTDGGPHFLEVSQEGTTYNSFFTYNSDLEHGYDSLWADIDGDSDLELITVPQAKQTTHVRAYETNGTAISGFFPHGESFKKGVQIVAGDIDGDGTDEIITAPLNKGKARVRIYSLENGSFERIDTVRKFKKKFKGGVSIAVGDIDGDGSDELIMGARSKKKKVHVYSWNSTKQDMKLLTSFTPFTGSNAMKGMELATGDITGSGSDEIVVASLTGGGALRSYTVSNGTVSKIDGIKTQPSSYVGGSQLAIANVNSSVKEEVLVLPRNHAEAKRKKMNIYLHKGGVFKRGKRFRVFKEFPAEGVSIALIDTNSDGVREIAAAKRNGSRKVRVFEKTSSGFSKSSVFGVYSSLYSGGLSLTQ